jgi:hypothetical protein
MKAFESSLLNINFLELASEFLKYRNDAFLGWNLVFHFSRFFCCNSILFAVCTSTFSKWCIKGIQWHAEECSVALLCN